jgi:alkylation response protein AidB-like acyl-CoA dehydrogenase
VAYGGLLQERRRDLHARIVRVFDSLYPGRAGELTSWLTLHAFRGELWDRAVAYLRGSQLPNLDGYLSGFTGSDDPGAAWWVGDHEHAIRALGMHGMDTSDPGAPRIVHAFMPRATEGYSIKETWNVLGMRATASQDTMLQGAFVPDRYIARVVSAGFAGADLFILAIFAWALTGFANVYYGLAQRTVDLTIDNLKTKTSIGVSSGSLIHHPEVQHAIADMVIELEGIVPQLDRLADDWTQGVDHGGAWPVKIVAAKYRTVEAAWKVVDTAFDLAGGYGIFAASGMERMFRDARLSRIHPANSALTHEVVAKLTLGINPDAQPRWG